MKSSKDTARLDEMLDYFNASKRSGGAAGGGGGVSGGGDRPDRGERAEKVAEYLKHLQLEDIPVYSSELIDQTKSINDEDNNMSDLRKTISEIVKKNGSSIEGRIVDPKKWFTNSNSVHKELQHLKGVLEASSAFRLIDGPKLLQHDYSGGKKKEDDENDYEEEECISSDEWDQETVKTALKTESKSLKLNDVLTKRTYGQLMASKEKLKSMRKNLTKDLDKQYLEFFPERCAKKKNKKYRKIVKGVMMDSGYNEYNGWEALCPIELTQDQKVEIWDEMEYLAKDKLAFGSLQKWKDLKRTNI